MSWARKEKAVNYIVNPGVFYWLSVINAIKCVSIVVFILSAVAAVVLIGLGIDKSLWCEDEYATFNKWKKAVAVVLPISTVAVIFIPGKEALIEMLVAKYATVDNANWTLDAVKSAVDYIVEAMKAIK